MTSGPATASERRGAVRSTRCRALEGSTFTQGALCAPLGRPCRARPQRLVERGAAELVGHPRLRQHPDLSVPDADCHLITDRVLVRGSSPAWGPADVAGAQTPLAPAAPTPPTLSTPAAKPDNGAPAKPMAGTVVATRPRGADPRARTRRQRHHPRPPPRPAGCANGRRGEAERQAWHTDADRPAQPPRTHSPASPRGASALRRDHITAPNGAARTEKLRVSLRR